MITVAVVNTKGGVGKTTIAAALAVRASHEETRDGKARVCMVDLDPQRSLARWWERRPKRTEDESPRIFTGVDEAADAVERAELAGYDWCFIDGPPAFLTTIREMIAAADFAVIPVKPSTVDLQATEDVIVLARDAGTAFFCVFSDVGQYDGKLTEKAREVFTKAKVPVAEEPIAHRLSHVAGMNAGKTGAEVNNRRDKKAAEEIDKLWQQVKDAATKSARARAKAQEMANG